MHFWFQRGNAAAVYICFMVLTWFMYIGGGVGVRRQTFLQLYEVPEAKFEETAVEVRERERKREREGEGGRGRERERQRETEGQRDSTGQRPGRPGSRPAGP